MSPPSGKRKVKSVSGPWEQTVRLQKGLACMRWDGVPKIRYDAEAEAVVVAVKTTVDRDNGQTWMAYSCPDCSGWHVGRPSQARFDLCYRQRHYDDWSVELGDRAESWLWNENHPRSGHRFLIRKLRKVAVRNVMAKVRTSPPPGRWLP